MKISPLVFMLFNLLPAIASATWLNVGKVDYNWGPFKIYTISLYSENGQYEAQQRPLMLSLKYMKTVDGKNFAITLNKEINSLGIKDSNQSNWLKILRDTLPDLQPDDTLSYIALADKGYFVLNDTILAHEFDSAFNNAFLAIWLDPNSNFKRLQPQLLGQANQDKQEEQIFSVPEIAPVEEDTIDPKLKMPVKMETLHTTK